LLAIFGKFLLATKLVCCEYSTSWVPLLAAGKGIGAADWPLHADRLGARNGSLTLDAAAGGRRTLTHLLSSGKCGRATHPLHTVHEFSVTVELHSRVNTRHATSQIADQRAKDPMNTGLKLVPAG
jgi:hypothetical protein